MLWQPPIVITSRYTQLIKLSAGYQVVNNHKRTWQRVSAILLSYLYYYMIVCATNNYTCPYIHTLFSYPSYVLLKATMLYSYALILSSRFFYHVLGLWHHIMWHVMWMQHHIPLHCPKDNQRKENKINIKSEKLNKRKEKLLVSKAFYNRYRNVSTLYIPVVHEAIVYYTWVYESYNHEERVIKQCLLYEMLTETTMVQPIISSLPLALLVLAVYMRY